MHWQELLAYLLGLMSCWYGHVAGMKYAGMKTVPQSKLYAALRTIGSVLLMVTALIVIQQH